MNYKELQIALKAIKLRGLSDVKLNSSKEVLQAEYDRTKDLKTLRESLDEKVADGEVLYPTAIDQLPFELAVNSFIGIIDKVLFNNFGCDCEVNISMVLEKNHYTIKEFLAKVAKDADVNTIDFLLAVEQTMEDDFNFDLTDYRHDTVGYFLKKFNKKVKKNTKTTSPVLEIVTTENDPSFDTAIEYFTKAVNHVFKRLKSHNIIAKGFLTHYIVNDVSVNDFIKFINLNSGLEITEFIEYLEYHLEDQYEYFIKYSYLDYGKYPVKMILQDFAEVINIHQLVA